MSTDSAAEEPGWTGQRYAELCRQRQAQYQTAVRFRQSWYSRLEALSSGTETLVRPAGAAGLYVAAESFSHGQDGRSFVALEALGQQDQDAAVIAELRASALALLPQIDSPGQLLSELNTLWSGSCGEPFVAAWAARYEPKQKRLLWSSAGWSTLLFLNPAGQWNPPDSAGPLLGLLASPPYKVQAIEWSAETMLLLGGLAFTSAARFQLRTWLNQQRRLSPRALALALTEAWHRQEHPTASLPFVWIIHPGQDGM